MLKVGQDVGYQGCVGTVIRVPSPPISRIDNQLKAVGEFTATILFSDGVTPTREEIVPESSWDQVEVIEPDAR